MSVGPCVECGAACTIDDLVENVDDTFGPFLWCDDCITRVIQHRNSAIVFSRHHGRPRIRFAAFPARKRRR